MELKKIMINLLAIPACGARSESGSAYKLSQTPNHSSTTSGSDKGSKNEEGRKEIKDRRDMKN
jgi:hypothetical protein